MLNYTDITQNTHVRRPLLYKAVENSYFIWQQPKTTLTKGVSDWLIGLLPPQRVCLTDFMP
jgi:hypothetical protein